MQISEAIQLFEDNLKHFNLSAAETRCEGVGEYLITVDQTEIYIDLWQPERATQWQYFERDKPAGIFQVVAPVCSYPAEHQLSVFFEELAHLNFNLFYGCFIANAEQKIISIQYKRIIQGLNETEIIEPIDAIVFYAQNLKEYLHEKYKVQKI